MNHLQTSLELLDRYLSRTSPEDLAALIKECESYSTSGPTVSEYFDSFSSQYTEILSTKLTSQAKSSFNGLGVDDEYLNYKYSYPPPPVKVILDANLEDSVIFTESFFLV